MSSQKKCAIILTYMIVPFINESKESLDPNACLICQIKIILLLFTGAGKSLLPRKELEIRQDGSIVVV